MLDYPKLFSFVCIPQELNCCLSPRFRNALRKRTSGGSATTGKSHRQEAMGNDPRARQGDAIAEQQGICRPCSHLSFSVPTSGKEELCPEAFPQTPLCTSTHCSTPGHNVGSKKETIMPLTLTNQNIIIFYKKNTLAVIVRTSMSFSVNPVPRRPPSHRSKCCLQTAGTILMVSCVTHPYRRVRFFFQARK